MPSRNSINRNEATALRRSPRLLRQKSAKIQKPKTRKNGVCPSSLSPSEKSPFSLIDNVSLKKTHEVYPEKISKKNLFKSIDGSENHVETINGSRKSTIKINGVKGFEGLRRSPRFSNMTKTPELMREKQGADKTNGVNGESHGLECAILLDFLGKEVSLVLNQKENSGKRRTRSSGVMILGKTEVDISSSDEIARCAEAGRSSISAITSVMTPNEEGEKKGRNFKRGNEEIWDKMRSHQCKENFGFQKVGNRSNNTRLRSPLSSIENISPKTTQQYPEKVGNKSVRSNACLKKSVESVYGSRKSTEKINRVKELQGPRRSSRLSNLENVDEKSRENISDRVNRKSTGKIDRVKGIEDPRQSSRFSNEEIVDEKSPDSMPDGLSRKSTGKFAKVEGLQGPRRSSRFLNMKVVDEKSRENMPDRENRNNTPLTHHILTDFSGKVIFSEEIQEGNSDKRKWGRRTTSVISPAMMPQVGGEKKINVNTGIEEIGDERSNECEENCGLQGWTKDQEVALQRAYFATKPSPHFWKKVSKLVLGKSAQECFDKIHSDLRTPPQPRPRSRTNRLKSSPLGHFSHSGSKLLEPADLNIKRPRSNKQKKIFAQKTVRHLLQKHYVVDQGYEADLFSVLEPTMNSSTLAVSQTKMLSTPACISKKQGFLEESHKMLLSAHKNPLLRFSACHTALVSPPVLKPIKNMALHEKYIDQLHCREARRMAGCRNCISAKEDRKDRCVQKMDVVKAAQNTLVSDAKDMINQFQQMQANAISSYGDFDDDDDDDGEAEGEDKP